MKNENQNRTPTEEDVIWGEESGRGGGGGVVYRTATLTSGALRVGSASFSFSVTHVHAAPVGPSVRPPPLSLIRLYGVIFTLLSYQAVAVSGWESGNR